MLSWILRNRRRLEAIYGAPSHLSVRTSGPSPAHGETAGASAAPAAGETPPGSEGPSPPALAVYELYPRRRLAA